MPTSLDEALTSGDPPSSNTDRSQESALKKSKTYPESAREPLAASKTKHEPGITFAAEDKLPKLPIPELENSCRKYLEALKPLQTTREHETSTAAVHEFLAAEGPDLQERLKKYATGKTSYIEQFCG